MSAMKEFLPNSYLCGANAPFIEELYEAYLDDPQSAPEQWREYFDELQRLPAGANAGSVGRDVAHAPIVESFARRARAGAAHPVPAVAGFDLQQGFGLQLIAEYPLPGVPLPATDPPQRRGAPPNPAPPPRHRPLPHAHTGPAL